MTVFKSAQKIDIFIKKSGTVNNSLRCFDFCVKSFKDDSLSKEEK